jgi:hypothetical protein
MTGHAFDGLSLRALLAGAPHLYTPSSASLLVEGIRVSLHITRYSTAYILSLRI